MSTIKVDTIQTRTGSGNITASNTIAGTSATLSGTLGVTGTTTTAAITSTGRHEVNFNGSGTQAFKYTDTGGGNLASFGQFYNPSNALIANIQNANNDGIHINVKNGSLVFGNVGYTAANALDDYEEGTWTPTLDFGGNSTGLTYSTQSARYTKIGNVVNFSFRMYLTSKGSSTGHAHVGGFPFPADAMPTGGVFQLVPARGWLSSSDEPIYLYFNSGTRMPVYYNDWDGTANSAATHGSFANNTEIELTASYFTNS
jgi:hypothetical protein